MGYCKKNSLRRYIKQIIKYMTMKRQILISLISLSFIVTMNAQIYTPSGTIQGSSGNDNIGLGIASPSASFHIHTSTADLLIENSGIEGAYMTVHSGRFNRPALTIYKQAGTAYWQTGILYDESGNQKYSIGTAQSLSSSKLTIQSNGNIGIGTNTPSYPLSFGTNGGAALALFENAGGGNMTGIRYNASRIGLELIANDGVGLYIANGSNIGIGTNLPSDKLQIGDFNNSANLKINIPGVYNFEQVKLGQYGNGSCGLELINHSGPANSYGVRLFSNTDNGIAGLQIQTASPTSSYQNLSYTTRLAINTDGNIGIGTINPAYKLDVIGTIRAREVKIDLLGADFVFDKNYDLKDLSEVKDYINKNKHLPDIESAKEMEGSGVNIGEMQAKLLQKIEELTLYTIQQNDKIKALEQKMIELESKK